MSTFPVSSAREHFSKISGAWKCEAAVSSQEQQPEESARQGQRKDRDVTSIQCIDQIKEALQLQKGKQKTNIFSSY